MEDDNNGAAAPIEAGSAGAPEGTPAREPSHDEIAELYKATGVKAPVPTGKPKGRPKTDDGGDKKTAKKDDASGGTGKGQADDDGKDKSKASSASDSDGDDGNDADSKGKKVSSSGGKDGKEDSAVSGDSDEDAEGVSDSKSKDNGKAAKSGEDDAGEESDGAGEEDGKSGAASEEDKEGKRADKRNPEVEKRFQKLTGDVKERDQVIADLTKKLQEKDNLVAKTKIAQEDPEYTVEDFRKVQDKDGNIIDLDPERAELAWRRWKDGYDQRAEQRQAAQNHANAQIEREAEVTRELMTKSVAAYDTLAGLMDEYPELVSGDKYDADFAAEAMPIIQDAIEYAPGTEPGNAAGNLPVIMGLRIDPKKILKALKNIDNKKRNLPLNGVNDNVDRGSGVSVSHSRSSDPTVQAANELYKELGIKKRI